MPTSIRQQIVDAVTARLLTITTDAGYQNTIAPNVFRWRVTDLQESELPGIIFKDTEDTRALACGSDIHSLNVQLELATLGATSPDDLSGLIADVVVALGVDPTFGGLASDTIIKSDKMSFTQKERLVGVVTFAIEIQFVTAKFNPYQ